MPQNSTKSRRSGRYDGETRPDGGLIGHQIPRIWTAPNRNPAPEDTAAGEFIDLAESAGLILDPWQRWVLEICLAEDPNTGLWECFECCLIVARQNGKGSVLEALELGWLFLLNEQVAHSAQLMSTSRKHYARLLGLIRGAPHLSVLVPTSMVYRSADNWSIGTTRGGLIEFISRSSRGGRGDGKDKVVYDEAMFLDTEEIAAQVPTMSTTDNPQLWYTSSAGRMNSTQLRHLRDRGRRGDTGLAYMEWSSPVPDDGRPPDYADESLWPYANPGLGKRISLHYCRGEYRAMSNDLAKFGRERLSIFDEPTTSGRVITAAQWDSLANLGAVGSGAAVFGLTVTPERDAAAITVAAWQASGVPIVEVVTLGPGGAALADDAGVEQADEQLAEPEPESAGETPVPAGLGWVVQWCAERPGARMAIQQGAPAAPLAGRLQAVGVEVELLSTQRTARASMGLFDAVKAEQLAHLGDEVLGAAVGDGRKRDLGRDGGWIWSQPDSTGDIGPLVGVSMALDVLTSGSAERVYSAWSQLEHGGELPTGLDEPDTDPGWPRIWVYGLGLRRPLVWQCWVQDPEGTLWLQHEIYRSPQRLDGGRVVPVDPAEVGREIAELGLPAPRTVLSATPRADRRKFEQAFGRVARAPYGELAEGIAAVQARVARGQLRIPSGTVIGIDQSLRAAARPVCTVDEIAGYVWPADREKEVPCGDAWGLDCARWVVAHCDLRGPASIRWL